MKIVVSGSTGVIGSLLVNAFNGRGHEVIRLIRPSTSVASPERKVRWDPEHGTIDRAGLAGADAVVHLAGENVFGRWSETKKRRIRESRVHGTRLLSETLATLARRPATLLSASAIGYYGDRGDGVLTEQSGPGNDFLADVAREWEGATAPADQAGIRVVQTRFGVVLTTTGGAMGKMLPPFRLGLGGPIGTGSQFVSWIERSDLVKAILHLLTQTDLSGPVNLTSPTPVTSREFAATLGRVLGRPAVVAVPAFALRMAFGTDAAAMLQSGQRVLPERLVASGFQFRFETIEPALRHLLAPSESAR